MTLGDERSRRDASGKDTAYELRNRFVWLKQFTDDELRDIAFCREEVPLAEGDEYFDVSRPERGEIVARRGEIVPPGACYVWRGAVVEKTWNKLTAYGKSREAGR